MISGPGFAMSLILSALLLLSAAAILYHIVDRIGDRIRDRIARLGPTARGSHGRGDPRIAVAAMIYAVATEYAPLTSEQERHILALMCARMAIDPALAREYLAGGRRTASRLRGDLNSRLHQLVGPVEHSCNHKERQDVIDMLQIVAGPFAQRLGPVRDGLGRVSATLKRS
jgi:hypothetical protein